MSGREFRLPLSQGRSTRFGQGSAAAPIPSIGGSNIGLYSDGTTLFWVTGGVTRFYANSGGMVLSSARLNMAQGAAVAAANNLALGTDGNYFQISGATQINLLSASGWLGGAQVTLKFASTPTVKHNQVVSGVNKPILLAGAVDFVASANDTLTLVYDGTDAAWYEVARAVI